MRIYFQRASPFSLWHAAPSAAQRGALGHFKHAGPREVALSVRERNESHAHR